jgi:aminobutyraldehyde dehydrogenase
MATTAISRHEMFIDGEQRAALDGATAAILDPATGQQIAEVPDGGAADVDLAVAAADRAFEGWSRTTPGERALALLRLAERVDGAREELAQLESSNVGKPMGLAREEMEMIVDHIRFFAGAGRVLEGRAAGEYMAGHTSIIRRDPLGVVGSVAPWNYPLLMAIWKLCPALVAGNTIVLKPSEYTPLTVLRLAELAADLMPPGVLNVVTGDGDPVGVALVSHPRVRMSSLTGDVATGREVMRAAANSNLKRLHLELGGKAPVIILDDANIELAVSKIREGAFCNSGQDCMAAARIYATEGVHDDLLAALVPAITSLDVGTPLSESTEMGPVVSAVHRDRVTGFLDRAEQSGHIELARGAHSGDPNGFFVEPTVAIGAQQDDEIVQREVFGPVVSVTRTTDEQVVGWANDLEYGLAASVFTSNVARALDLARQLQFGTVWINDHLPVVAEMPHGGFKQSGNGKDMSIYSIEEYTEIKHVMVNIEES